MLDSEGRTLILEFPAFVLIGVYVPATRDDTRTDFRIGFLNALDARIRNLVAMGKQVILAGDLNIIRSDLDTAGCAEHLRKEGMTLDDFMSTPSRRLFNQLLFEGHVIGDRDEGREESVMWDTTRCFHPDRPGMYTCWETKKNARPGNFGSRIDYILCTAGIKNWFEDGNIQEGLIGSDHCPVYATFSDQVKIGGEDRYITDIMNPRDMFKDGQRLREWDVKDLLPQSAKLLNEFDRRRNIKDMFTNRPAPSRPAASITDMDLAESGQPTNQVLSTQMSVETSSSDPGATHALLFTNTPSRETSTAAGSLTVPPKRAAFNSSSQPSKKAKTSAAKEKGKLGSNQSSLRGFFKPKMTALDKTKNMQEENRNPATSGGALPTAMTVPPARPASVSPAKSALASSQLDGAAGSDGLELAEDGSVDERVTGAGEDRVFDPIESKESWSKLLGNKRAAPLCEHEEPCISFQTKKPGVNKGK